MRCGRHRLAAGGRGFWQVAAAAGWWLARWLGCRAVGRPGVGGGSLSGGGASSGGGGALLAVAAGRGEGVAAAGGGGRSVRGGLAWVGGDARGWLRRKGLCQRARGAVAGTGWRGIALSGVLFSVRDGRADI